MKWPSRQVSDPGCQRNWETAETATAFPGAIQPSILPTAPAGWVLCDGSALVQPSPLRSALLAASSPFGVTGSDPKLPDLRGRIPVGAGTATGAAGATAHALGSSGGEETHKLLAAEGSVNGNGTTTLSGGVDHLHNPSAGFTAFHGKATGFGGTGGGTINDTMAQTGGADRSLNHQHPFTARDADSSHNNMQPFVTVNYFIFLG